MDHDSDQIASQDGTQGTQAIEDQQEGAETAPASDSPEAEDGTDVVYEKMINENLKAFRGQFRRLKEAIELHIEDIEQGKVEGKDVTDIVKRIDPLLNNSILQETKFHEKLAQRLGQAGRHAVDLGSARIEIGRRLARLRDTARNA